MTNNKQIVIDTVDNEPLAVQGNEQNDKSIALIINSDDTLLLAKDISKASKALRKKIVTFFKEPKAILHKAHADMRAQEKGHLDTLNRADRTLNNKMVIYGNEVTAIMEAKRLEMEREQAERFAQEKKAASLKIGKIAVKGESLQSQIASLEEIRNNAESTDIKCAIAQAKIVELESQQSALEQKIKIEQSKAERRAIPQPVYVAPPRVTVKIKKVKVPDYDNVNLGMLVQAVARDMSLISALQVNKGGLKKLIQDMDIAGVPWHPEESVK